MNLQRFKEAQADPYAGFNAALAELRAGGKTSHWIWYIFPQLAGLGMSGMSRTYGIADAEEAAAYLRDPTLRCRLLEAATVVEGQLRGGVTLPRLMGSSIDVLKLVSSMTLFEAVARRLVASEPSGDYSRLAEVAAAILVHAEREGYLACAFTLKALRASWRSG